MNIKDLIGNVLRDNPKEIHYYSQQLLIRSGYFRLGTNNEFITMTTGNMALNKLKKIILEQFNSFNEINFPEINQDILISFISKELSSYKNLPASLYSYYLEKNKSYELSSGLFYPKYNHKLTLLVINETKSDNTIDIQFLGDKLGIQLLQIKGTEDNSIEFITKFKGNEKAVFCENDGYTARSEIAEFDKKPIGSKPKDMEKVHTPNCKTIEEVSNYLNVEITQTAKAVFYSAIFQNKYKLVFVVIRGDLEVNEFLLKTQLGCEELRDANEQEIKSINAVPGYASPIGIDREECILVVDDSIVNSNNLVAGANEKGYHLVNTNYDRDYTADIVANIAQVKNGYSCKCGGKLEVRDIFVVGYRRILENPSTYTGKDGKPHQHSVILFEFSLEKLLAMIAESNNDDYGLILPLSITPFKVHLLNISKSEAGLRLYNDAKEKLVEMGIELLVDNRKGKPGPKFVEADLRGIPVRIVISDRLAKEKQIEVKNREDNTKVLIDVSNLNSYIENMF